ncbi:conserved hypothetical protein [Bradyrhizobium sp. STM 3843]|uniref:hypothetical protein n=1 Tax=Bradyrhizobium sp. STM 3843 TaxID=551947 RepID=UPI000240530B|nr:hypothetical protein [Bradyrhizobium sp. STM 3843]CCE08167.1 conserved hypothetical protein [Bradyrhizobium sp. STM 3843]
MSSLSEQNPTTNPQDPLHYAPRWVRERPEATRLSLVEETREKPQAGTDRTPSSSAQNTVESRLENAVFESLRHTLDPQVMREPPDFARERDRRSVTFKIAGRFAAAAGVAAVIALFFVNIVPASRQQDASSSFVAAVQAMKTTLPPPPAAIEAKDIKAEVDEPQTDKVDVKTTSALAQFQSLLPPDDQPQTAKSETAEKPLLQQFMQWNQKAGQPDKVQ